MIALAVRRLINKFHGEGRTFVLEGVCTNGGLCAAGSKDGHARNLIGKDGLDSWPSVFTDF